MAYRDIYLLSFAFQLNVWCLTGDLCSLNGDSRQCEHGCCDADHIDDVCCSGKFWTWYIIIGISLAAIVGIALTCFVVLTLYACYKKHKRRPADLRRTVSHRSNRVTPLYSVTPLRPEPPPYSETDTNPKSFMSSSPPPPYDQGNSGSRRSRT